MKILIYGAGVIGCTYGWQLSQAGCDITVMVRPTRRRKIEESGINILCHDYRTGKEQTHELIFWPSVIDKLSSDNDFEYIIISTGSHHLDEILPVLKGSAGKAHILFFQNLWISDLDKISSYLSPSQYFFGFPFMAGGGKVMNGIDSVISGSKYSKTMLGEAGGQLSVRVKNLAAILEKAGMRPFISGQIINWLIPHYAFIAAISSGILKAGGSMKDFLSDADMVKKSVRSIREAFHICRQAGYDPKKEKVNQLYYMPFFISISVMRKIFSDAGMSLMFDNYLKQSAGEIEHMLQSIIESGGKSDMEISSLIGMESKL